MNTSLTDNDNKKTRILWRMNMSTRKHFEAALALGRVDFAQMAKDVGRYLNPAENNDDTAMLDEVYCEGLTLRHSFNTAEIALVEFLPLFEVVMKQTPAFSVFKSGLEGEDFATALQTADALKAEIATQAKTAAGSLAHYEREATRLCAIFNDRGIISADEVIAEVKILQKTGLIDLSTAEYLNGISEMAMMLPDSTPMDILNDTSEIEKRPYPSSGHALFPRIA